jgi:hypothetical protein
MDKSAFVSELGKLRSSSTFLTLKGYRNEHGEVADYSIVFNMSYKNALTKSLMTLESFIPNNANEVKARLELIESFKTSLSKPVYPVEEPDETYSKFYDDDGTPIKGVKLHNESDTLYLYGLIVHKKVIMQGSYKEKNKRELTIAKDKLRKLTPLGKFRQFKILPENVDSISVENISLLPPE